MSIFSSLKKSRQQAKDHKSKVAEQKKKEDINAPYKHVPTHAASDAFASAPPSYREDDRPRIVEQNRRRSAMAASGHHMNMPGVPRVGSSLSHVTYPGHEAHPVPPLPRAYSYAGVSPYAGGSRENRDPAMSAPDMAYFNQTSLKGKEVPRTFAGETQAFSKSPSPVESVDGSTSSQDDLEMKPTRSRTQGADVTGAHRLHPSRTRRKSDASANQYTISAAAKSPYAGQNRDPRPPPSMRAFGSIPAIASLPPVNIGGPLSAFPTPGESGQSVLNQGSPAAPIAANKDNADVPQPPQVRDSTPPQPQLKVNDQPANVFPEAVGSESADPKSGKGKRVLKANGGKSPKKHRWAFSKTPAAVAV